MKDRLYNEVLPLVSKPIRYTGNEYNIIKKDWEKSQARMVFAFPDVYEIGMSHIGGKILYGVINETTRHVMERAFAPWPDMEKVMREKDIPLYALESFKPLYDFDAVGFSLQYELSITNILNMLDLAHIPIWAKERGNNDPIIVGGGPVTFNPEPFAPFFDVFLIGDGEEVIVEFMDLIYATRGLERSERLTEFAKIEGAYVPSLYTVNYNPDNTIKSMNPRYPHVPEKVSKRLVKDLDHAYYPEKPILPYMEIVHDRAVLEVMRGCQRACRFCHAGTVYRPVRERHVDTLRKQAQAQIASTGYDEISLASLSTLDYSAINCLAHDLVDEFSDKGIGISLPSLRVDAFSIDLANEVQKVRKTTLTLAPEAGTQRLRDVINKNISEEDLTRAVEAAFKSGWLGVKLYFMFGLPTETEADLDGILDLVQKVKSIGNRYSRRPVEIRASLACFVPKAHTPFQWQAQDSIVSLDNKKKYLRASRYKNIKISFHDSRTSFLEGVIARGDRRLAEVIYEAWEKGCKFDGWSEYFRFDTWMEAFRTIGIDPEFYTERVRHYDEIFPWDFIDTGVSKKYLQLENEKATRGETTPDCRTGGCAGCGICQHFDCQLDIKYKKEGNE
ncbi:MAG TPA: TIGR03960 family B12-binding radical SAM protein [Syntrophomonadaceae bacterium]|nr:TIGR03960 family B12-binding radical SAM protein [Syntrophomonadaceae bacterium]